MPSELVSELTVEELSLLNERKNELKGEHEEYVNEHPELKTLLSSFMTAVLMEKPENVLDFARAHFAGISSVDATPSSSLFPLVITGPSGVGKGTLISKLMGKYPNSFGFSVSHTTRKPRPGEVDGVHYHFTEQDKIKSEIETGTFLEYAEVHGNIYGTTTNAVLKVQKDKKICILDIDVQGAQIVHKSKIACKYLFITPPSMEELENRLRQRGTEMEDKVALRVKNAKAELEYAEGEGNFDRIIVNNELEETFTALEEQLQEWYPTMFKK